MYIDENGMHDVPIIDFVARKRGEWVQHGLRFQFYCSNCEHEIMTNVYSDNPTALWKFCPNCGADMRGEEDG